MASGTGRGYGEPLPTRQARDDTGKLLPILDRFLGVTGALWNVPHSATLVARPESDGKPCELLLIKRRVLLDIEEKCAAFRLTTSERFLAHELPDLLVENRLFRNTFYAGDVANWSLLLDLLCKRSKGTRSAAIRRIRRLLDEEFKDWLATLPNGELGPRERYQILSGLNTVLKRRDLYARRAWRQERLFFDCADRRSTRRWDVPSATRALTDKVNGFSDMGGPPRWISRASCRPRRDPLSHALFSIR
jgi:hypothetical protein